MSGPKPADSLDAGQQGTSLAGTGSSAPSPVAGQPEAGDAQAKVSASEALRAARNKPSPFGYEIPFVTWVGLEMVYYEGGKSLMTLDPEAHHMNSMGMAHGGVVMTMLDVSMATAARSAAKAGAPEGEEPRVITIEMKVSFMKPSTGQLRCYGTVLSHTRSMAFCEAEIRDGHDRVCAKASGTFRYIRLHKH